MKDFYDIYYLASVFDFEGAVLQKAVTKTMEHRGHKLEKGIFERFEVFDRHWNCSAGYWEGSSCNKEDKGTG